jgi:uncharacterized RDD family membrane protein YckC
VVIVISSTFEKPYAGFWRRLAAYAIDRIILRISILLLTGIILWMTGDRFTKAFDPNPALDTTMSLVFLAFSIVAQWLYFAFFESSSWQATPGKKLIGIVVTDENGNRIGFGRATGRFFGKYLSWLILGIGFLMAGWTKRKQALHDTIAGTLVVKEAAIEL